MGVFPYRALLDASSLSLSDLLLKFHQKEVSWFWGSPHMPEYVLDRTPKVVYVTGKKYPRDRQPTPMTMLERDNTLGGEGRLHVAPWEARLSRGDCV